MRCTNCGARQFDLARQDEVITVRGKTYTLPGIERYRCRACGDEVFTGEQSEHFGEQLATLRRQEEGPLDPGAVLARLELAEPPPGWSEATAVELAGAGREAAGAVDVEAQLHQVEDDGPPALSWRCPASQRSRLTVGGQPLIAYALYYHCEGINWQAGPEWPWFTAYCPTQEKRPQFPYPEAFCHQVVPEFGGSYWIGDHNPGGGTGLGNFEVFFSVNDDRRDDNQGGFTVVVTALRKIPNPTVYDTSTPV